MPFHRTGTPPLGQTPSGSYEAVRQTRPSVLSLLCLHEISVDRARCLSIRRENGRGSRSPEQVEFLLAAHAPGHCPRQIGRLGSYSSDPCHLCSGCWRAATDRERKGPSQLRAVPTSARRKRWLRSLSSRKQSLRCAARAGTRVRDSPEQL